MFTKFFYVGLVFVSLEISDFQWPKEVFSVSNGDWHRIALEEAPPHFNVEGLTDEEFIKRADAVYVNLRSSTDRKQLIINNGGGGSGGRAWSIFDRKDGKWIYLGEGEGLITICTPAKGYAQIESWSRGGGGNFTKMLLRFEGDRYHLVRLEDWKDIDDFGHRKLVGIQDPKPFDN